MAHVRFMVPFSRITGKDSLSIDAGNVRELCKMLYSMFGQEIGTLLDDKEELSNSIIMLVNRRNAHTIKGAETPLNQETEVIIMQYFGGG